LRSRECQLDGRRADRRKPLAPCPDYPYYNTPMNFKLTPQMIDKIAFAMEDQEEEYLIDPESGELSARSLHGENPDDSLAPLPRWGSAEGFHLMESFVTTLHNPVYHELLASALSNGKGVFRSFKDTLKKNHEIEKLWFRYKERRLRAVIIAWYNVNREARGLEKMAPEPEDTEELVASDFSLEWGLKSRLEELRLLDREAFIELFPKESRASVDARYRAKREVIRPLEDESSLVLVAETPSGELAGFAWGVEEGRTVHLVQLAVVRELRGIGLGESIMHRFLLDIRDRGMGRLTTELAGKSLRFSDFFQSLGFRPLSQILECSLEELSYGTDASENRGPEL
jgi:ribosomal protein S18 acetylase RimI-like enzyme